MVTDRYQ